MIAIIISILILAMIVSGILFIKQTARKFDIDEELQQKIKQRQQEWQQDEKDNE